MTTDFRAQATETLALLDSTLLEAGSNRNSLLSVQVLLSDIKSKPDFDEMWEAWIGADERSWPQRVCLEMGLAPGLLLEVVVIATSAQTLQDERSTLLETSEIPTDASGQAND